MSRVLASLLSILSICVLTVISAPVQGNPPERLLLEPSESSFQQHPIHRFFLPIDIAPVALAGAFKAHAHLPYNDDNVRQNGGDNENKSSGLDHGDFFPEKRTTTRSDFIHQLRQDMGHSGLLSMKRKMFWQPLGYMPASARAHQSTKDRVSSARATVNENGSNVFRYG